MELNTLSSLPGVLSPSHVTTLVYMELLRKTIVNCPYLISSSVMPGIELEAYYLIPSKFDDEVVALKSYIVTSILRHPLKWAFVWPRRFGRRKITHVLYSVRVKEETEEDVPGRTIYELAAINSWQRVVTGEIIVWSTVASTKNKVDRVYMAVTTNSTVAVFSNSKEGMEIDDRENIESLALTNHRTNINFDLQLDLDI